METGETVKKEKDYLLPASIIVAAVLISGAIIYLVGSSKGGNNQGGDSGTISDSLKKETPRDVILGEPNAPVTIIEYGDYQCPFCSRFFDTTERSIRENYVKPGKAKMVFRNFQFIGAESELAAQAAECAKDQGSFWAYHDAIYAAELRDGKENNGNLNKTLFVQIANDLKLNVNDFTSCYDSGKYVNQVKDDTSSGSSLGINSTPTLFVNGQVVKGALPYEQFQPIIENALKAATQSQ
ncbi:MAG: DsbA family protein [Candidatus Liptonbacteria bacterium]|nr:DsbA family protein [Candidatus Liptonbacteria bacterium]